MDRVVEVATLKVLLTVKSDVCKVIVPLVDEAVRLYKVALPPVSVAEELVIKIVEAPAVIVPPAKLRLPPIVCVASAKVIEPDKVRLRSVWLLEVRVLEEPLIVKVLPAEAVKVQFVRLTFPETVQLPEPVIMLFAVPAEQVRSAVRLIIELYVAPVRVTSPLPDSATSRLVEKVIV